MDINQTHYGSGDNVAGNKIIINKQPERSVYLLKDELIEKIKRFPQNYKIFLSNGDHEMESFAKEIDQAFKEAGWTNTGFIYKLVGFYDPGITFGVKEVDKPSQDIANLFHSKGFKVTANKYSDIDQFHIIIGPNK
ncbi:MAG: hypothetical protein HGA67_03405 [Candidatus Yonathbacteria bacterium]|nr:hypothetical protein [Candidatus Yonathbacteria bacterium]